MKASRAVTPIALVVLAVGSVAYAYFVDRGTVSDEDRAERRRDVFPSFRIEDVRRIELTHSTERLVLEHGTDGGAAWTMISPRNEPADLGSVDALLRELELAARVRDVPDGGATGLDAPRVRGRVDLGPLQYRFALGADAPQPEGAAYMRVDGEGTFVVGRSLKVQLLRSADVYRNRVLVPYGAGDVERVEVSSHDGTFALQRSGATFRLQSAGGLRASRTAVGRLFRALSDARAETFADDAAADRATQTPVLTIKVVPRDATRPPVRLLVGDTCPDHPDDRVAVRSPSHVGACIAKGILDGMGVTAESLVDRSPFFSQPDEIEELRLERIDNRGPIVDIARRGTGWHERSPDDRDLDSDAGESATALALALADSQALDARLPGPAERIVPRTRATIVRTGIGTNEVIELGAPGADGVALARRLDDGAVLRLPRAVVRRLEPHPVALRGRTVWQPSFDPSSVVAIDDTCGPTRQRLEFHDGAWTMRTPPGFTPDAASAMNVAEAFAHAKADAWIAESDDGTFGLEGADSCAVTLTMSQVPREGGAPLQVGIVFGGEDHESVYARTTDGEAVFAAPSTLREIASHPAIDRSRFQLDSAKLARVTLTRGGARLVLVRSGDRLVLERRGDGGDDETVEGALTALYAQSAIHAGPLLHDEGLERPTLEIRAAARDDAGALDETRIAIGAPTHSAGIDAYFARVSGVDATFAVPRQPIDTLLKSW